MRTVFSFFEKPYRSWIPKGKKWKLKRIPSIEIDIVSHCNLNCKGCSHFSPIAEPWFIDVEKFRLEIERLAQLLSNDSFGPLYILGGEPLLHPNLCMILRVARRAFPVKKIQIITNGLLLPKMKDDFWKCCAENAIEIEVTKYPIDFDYSRVEEVIKGRKDSVHIEYKGRTKIFKKKQYKLPIDSTGQNDKYYSFRNCFMAGSCVNLSDGRLYTCSYAAFIERYNKKFNKNIPNDAENGIDIFDEKLNFDTIINKLSKPIPLCSYCDVKNREYGLRWKNSKKQESEWSV